MRFSFHVAALFFAFATTAIAASSTAKDKDDIRVGDAKGVTFSQFNKLTGDLLWELRASNAAPLGKGAVVIGGDSDWQLGNVEIRLYKHDDATKTTRASVIISTPECTYADRRKNKTANTTATSNSALRMRGAGDTPFTLDGEGWTWRDDNTKEVCEITLRKSVVFSLAETPQHGRSDIYSDRLQVQLQKGRGESFHIFHFTGNVRLLSSTKSQPGKPSEDTHLYADQFVVRIKNTAALGTAGSAADPAKNAADTATASTTERLSAISNLGKKRGGTDGAKDKNGISPGSLENLVADGNVEILSQGYRMTGNTCAYVNDTEIFTVTGNACVFDPARGLTVTGEQIVYKKAGEKIEVFARRANADTTTPVHLEIPSFAARLGDDGKMRKLTDAQITALPPAVVTGDYLLVDISRPERSLVEFRKNVRITDEKFALTADNVAIEAPRDPKQNRPFAGLSGDTNKLREKLNLIRASGNVRADYSGGKLECGQADIFPKTEIFLLSGAPVLFKDGVRLRGHLIELDTGKSIARIKSAPTGAPPRRAQVTFPPLATAATAPAAKAPQPASSAAARRRTNAALATTISCDNIVMTEDKKKDTAFFDLAGKVVFDGGLVGHCDRLTVSADTANALPAAGAKTPKPATVSTSAKIARVKQMTATGHVSIGTSDFTAEGGEAVVYPRVALVEKTLADDNGLDGRNPQFLVVRPHESTPAKRSRLIILADRDRATGSLSGALDDAAEDSADTAAAPTPIAAKTAPVAIDCDLMEIVSGAMRSRFFLRNNVELSSPELGLSGHCDNVEGVIIREFLDAPADAKAQPPRGQKLPEYNVTHIIGNGHVRLHTQGKGSNEGGGATGDRFDFFPLEKEIRLSGNPRLTGRLSAQPGQQFIYNWKNPKEANWRMVGETDTEGVQISKPKIEVPF